VPFRQGAHDFRLAVRTHGEVIIALSPFRRGDLIDQGGPLYNLVMQMPIDLVNLVAQIFEAWRIVQHYYGPSQRRSVRKMGTDGGDTRPVQYGQAKDTAKISAIR
jgi:hypothetical protein